MDCINPRCKQQMNWDKKTLTWHCQQCHAETKKVPQETKVTNHTIQDFIKKRTYNNKE